MNTKTKPADHGPEAGQTEKSGYRFGILATAPGLLGGAAIAVGVPVIGLVTVLASAAVATGFAATSVVGAALAAGSVSALVAAGIGYGANSGVIGAGGAVMTTVMTTVMTSIAAVVAMDKYNPKKVFAAVLGGSALSAAVTYGAAVNAPQAPAPAEAALPASTLHIESRGSTLCRDFKLSENTVASAAVNDKGETTYTLTVPKGCTLKP